MAIPWTREERVGRIRRARFSKITCRSENGVVVYGWEPDRIDDLTLENISIELDSWSGQRGGEVSAAFLSSEGCRAIHKRRPFAAC